MLAQLSYVGAGFKPALLNGVPEEGRGKQRPYNGFTGSAAICCPPSGLAQVQGASCRGGF